MEIDESFRAKAPGALVYAFLRDPAKCFPCLPGATYGKTDADGKFDGAITVRVGPVTMSYDGWAIYDEASNPEAGHLVIKGQGREKTGNGVVKMEMTIDVIEVDGFSEVKVHAEVGLAGQIVRLGRGMVKSVSGQVFKEFVARATVQLEAESAHVDALAAHAQAVAAHAAEVAAAEAADAKAAAPPPPPPPVAPMAPPPPEAAPANGLAIFFRALGAMLSDFFGRLFGRSPS